MEKLNRSESPSRYRMKHDLVQKPYKKTAASKFPEFIQNVKIECLHMKTLKSTTEVHVNPESSQIYCPICKMYLNAQTEGKTHLPETHPEGFLLTDSVTFNGCNQLFFVTGEISRKTLTTSVNIRNMTSVLNMAAESLVVKQVFVAAATELMTINRTAIEVDSLGTMTLNIPRMSLSEPVNLVIQCTGSREYFEQHRIWVAESLPFIINKARFCLNSDGRGRNNRQTRKLQTRLNYQPLTMLFSFINKENFQLKSNFTDVPPYVSVTMASEVVTTEMMYRVFLRFRTARVVDGPNYILTFLLLNAIEDLYSTTQLEQFKLKQTCRRIERREKPTYKFDVCREENFPHLLKEGDLITVNSLDNSTCKMQVDCTIVKIENGEIWFVPNDLMNFKHFGPEEFNLTFRKNRFGFMVEQHCLETLNPNVVEFCLFPQREHIPVVEVMERPHWFNPAISSNPEQQQAVQSILCGTSGRAPYILFGPPGTGKTATLVEAICQILHQNLETTILVTASSNFACDEISSRLIRYIHRKDIYRYYSKASQAKDIDSESSVDSNSIPGYNTPDFSFIKTYRVVIATLTMAGRLSIDQLPKGFFEYIFIDECGSVTEPNAIIPISLLVSLNHLTHVGGNSKPTKIVLAGDPKQLGPIVNCKLVGVPGLAKSLLERLMELDLYKPDTTGRYNSAVITKLLQNYRSHPEILHIPNKLFYDGQLQATAAAQIINFAIGWSFLPNPNFPIIFYPIQGYAQTDSITSSICNQAEIDVVFNYVIEITRNGINGITIPKNEIGVVTPYRKQAMRIRRKLANNLLTDIEVGSVEQFQGQEKMVIILSTVRSNTDTIGFLSNPRRLNVVLTRAKGLLIIVGNPNTLSQDENWNQLLRHCEKNYAYHIESSKVDKANALIGDLLCQAFWVYRLFVRTGVSPFTVFTCTLKASCGKSEVVPGSRSMVEILMKGSRKRSKPRKRSVEE